MFARYQALKPLLVVLDTVIHIMASKRMLTLPLSLRVSLLYSARSFSVLNRAPPNYDGHVPLNALERGALAAGSAVMSLQNPWRGGTFHNRQRGIIWTN